MFSLTALDLRYAFRNRRKSAGELSSYAGSSRTELSRASPLRPVFSASRFRAGDLVHSRPRRGKRSMSAIACYRVFF
jgi:hypothetical protein